MLSEIVNIRELELTILGYLLLFKLLLRTCSNFDLWVLVNFQKCESQEDKI